MHAPASPPAVTIPFFVHRSRGGSPAEEPPLPISGGRSLEPACRYSVGVREARRYARSRIAFPHRVPDDRFLGIPRWVPVHRSAHSAAWLHRPSASRARR